MWQTTKPVEPEHPPEPTLEVHVQIPVLWEEVFRPEEEAVVDDVEPDDAASDVPNEPHTPMLKGNYLPPPSFEAGKQALHDISLILHPKRRSGIGHNPFEGDELLQRRLQQMEMLLVLFVDKEKPIAWIQASQNVARYNQKGIYTAKMIRKWTQSFIEDRHNLPINLYGSWNTSMLDDGELAKDISMYLLSKGMYVRAMDIVHYLEDPEVQKKHSLTKSISLATAQWWMHMMDYRWTKAPSGQYVDGHERSDVVEYRQMEFLPTIAELECYTMAWNDGVEKIRDYKGPYRRVVIWWHDESTFYANDRQLIFWVHSSVTAIPRTKGEGISEMVADFVSADYGWLRFGEEEARVLFKAGKGREGYFTNADIRKHAHSAMNILDKHCPSERHVFVFDNATTHLKRADDALSARKMSKKPTKPGNPFFGVERNKMGANGKPIYASDGTLVKEKVSMAGALLPGMPQSLYFSPDHTQPGTFKGMQIILEERGFINLAGVRSECKDFKCVDKKAERCCLRRMLFNQPDFTDVEPLLQTECRLRGYQVVFLPKFHPELNFIEQCWGFAKRRYRLNPPSPREADLERNMVAALDSVPLTTMRRCDTFLPILFFLTEGDRYATRSLRFMHAYHLGLDGKDSAWAAKKFPGHRGLPHWWKDDFAADHWHQGQCSFFSRDLSSEHSQQAFLLLLTLNDAY